MKNINSFDKNELKYNSSILRKLGKAIFLVFCLCLFSCSDYLDVTPDNIPTIDHAFKNRAEAEKYLFGCFAKLPQIANYGQNPAWLGGDEMWSITPASIDLTLWDIARGAQGANSPLSNYYSTQSDKDAHGGNYMYTALSDCNIFLENIHKPYDLRDNERNRWIGEVKFLKAYFHFWLFRMYGPVEVIRDNLSVNASKEEVQRYREPVDDVVTYIVQLLDEAIELLPPVVEDRTRDLGRPDQVIALALKAQVLTYAASPLFNCNPDYADFKDNRGTQLFPQDKSVESAKWKRAADALKVAIDRAHQEKYSLFDFHTNYLANGLNEKTILAMQVRGAVTERWNPEIIWGETAANGLQQNTFPGFTSAHDGGGATGNLAPTLTTVEQFYTKNGVPIEEDKDWTGIDPMEIRTATADDRQYIGQGRKTINLHFDREARFYSSIVFDGGTFYGNNRLSDNTTNANYMWVNDISFFQFSLTNGRGNSTGYFCKKMINYQSSRVDNSTSTSIYRYAFPIIRLADLYLMYAETLNEAGTGAPDPDVYKYIDLVRARTGLQGVVESWANFAIDGNKPLTKEGMRDIIRRERLNELAFEGIRFWDLRRWKLAEQYMNRPVRGINVDNKARELYQLSFEKKDYLWPLKISTLIRNVNLKQNPGWD
jgi:hypothetical protein